MSEWKCGLCGAGPEKTGYYNAWTVTVSGEMGAPDDNSSGMYGDAFEHETQVCDKCTHRPDLVSTLLQRALELERTLRHCECCQSALSDGACPLCDDDGA